MNQKHSLIILKSNEYLEDYLKEKVIELCSINDIKEIGRAHV